MNLDDAIKAMREGKKVTHKYLLHTKTKSLRIIDSDYVDDEGYILNKLSVMVQLKSACFNEGWRIVEDANNNTESMNDFQIGDIVPYKNTRGNVKLAKITSFETIQRNGKVWFHGVDTETKAKVWYPVHISKTLKV